MRHSLRLQASFLTLLGAVLLSTVMLVDAQAQTEAPATPKAPARSTAKAAVAATGPASAPVPPTANLAVAAPALSKAQLIDKVLALWHPETVSIMMIQRPATDALQQSRIALQGRVSAEKHEATMKDITTDVQKYVDEATPLALASAERNKRATVGAMLEANFNDDELRQLIAILESPVKKKFEQQVPAMEKALGDKIAADAGPAIGPKLDAMKQNVAGKLKAAAIIR
jgi:hypothetical protein